MRTKTKSQKDREIAIKTAIIVLKERIGSTMVSIIKFVQSQYPDMKPQTLRAVARRMVNCGELLKVKRNYKISRKCIKSEINAGKNLRNQVTQNNEKIVIDKERKKPGRKPKKLVFAQSLEALQ